MAKNHLMLMEPDFLRLLLEGTGYQAGRTGDLVKQLGSELAPFGPSTTAIPGSVVFSRDLARCGIRLSNGGVVTWSFTSDNYSTLVALGDLDTGFVWYPHARGA